MTNLPGTGPQNLRSRRQLGFTLLEVILALAIGAALLATVFFAAELHLRLADRGPAQVEYTQRLAAVVSQLQADLRHTICPPEAVLKGSRSGAAEDAGSANVPPPYGVWGTSETLILYRTLLPLDLDLAEGRTTWLPRPVVYRVTYQAEIVQDADGTTAYVLYRSTVPADFESYADELPGPAETYPHVERLLDRVGFVQFAYFDGLDWLTSWGGETDPGVPPLAVELVLAVRPPEELGMTHAPSSLAQQYGISTDHEVLRAVVAVPTADLELIDYELASGTGSTEE